MHMLSYMLYIIKIITFNATESSPAQHIALQELINALVGNQDLKAQKTRI